MFSDLPPLASGANDANSAAAPPTATSTATAAWICTWSTSANGKAGPTPPGCSATTAPPATTGSSCVPWARAATATHRRHHHRLRGREHATQNGNRRQQPDVAAHVGGPFRTRRRGTRRHPDRALAQWPVKRADQSGREPGAGRNRAGRLLAPHCQPVQEVRFVATLQGGLHQHRRGDVLKHCHAPGQRLRHRQAHNTNNCSTAARCASTRLSMRSARSNGSSSGPVPSAAPSPRPIQRRRGGSRQLRLQHSLTRATVLRDNAACSPDNPLSASSKSPLASPCKYRSGSRSLTSWVRRVNSGNSRLVHGALSRHTVPLRSPRAGRHPASPRPRRASFASYSGAVPRARRRPLGSETGRHGESFP